MLNWKNIKKNIFFYYFFFNYSAIDHVAMGLDVTIDQEAAMDHGILNVITNWNSSATCQSSQDSGLVSSYPPTYQSL